MRTNPIALSLVVLAACSNQPGDDPGGDDGDDDPLPPPAWRISVDMSRLERFAPAAATTWTVSGTATASEGLDGVEVAGAPATMADGGAFTADVALAPGLNPIAIVTRDRAMHARKASRSVIAADYLAAGAHNPEGAALALTDEVVAGMAEGLAGEAGDVDVAAEILARDVLSQDSQCTTWPVDASQGTPQVDLVLDGPALWLRIRVPDLWVYFEGRCQGLLSQIPIAGEMGGTIDVWTQLTPALAPGADCLTAFAHTNPEVQIGGWYFDVWGTSGPLQGWLVQLFSGSKSAEARAQLSSEVGVKADELLDERLADISVFDRTSSLDLLGRPLSMHLCVAALERSGDTLIARVAAAATGAGTRFAPGAPQLDGPVPVPAAGELLLDANLVAQLLFASWQDGGLTRPTVEEVDIDVLTLVAPDLVGVYPSGTKVAVHLDGDLPAVVKATPAGPGDLSIELGDLMLSLHVGDERLFLVGAVLRLDLDLVPSGGALVPVVIGSSATAALLDEAVDANDDLLESVIATKVGSTASTLLTGASISLPELPGLTAPTDVVADDGGRFLRLR